MESFCENHGISFTFETSKTKGNLPITIIFETNESYADSNGKQAFHDAKSGRSMVKIISLAAGLHK